MRREETALLPFEHAEGDGADDHVGLQLPHGAPVSVPVRYEHCNDHVKFKGWADITMGRDLNAVT